MAEISVWIQERQRWTMTMDEASERYNIPMDVLKEYEAWNLGGSAGKDGQADRFDDSDLEKLSLIVTLRDTGFAAEEIRTYMHLLREGSCTERERMHMLDKKRKDALNEIHAREKQMETLDYLRYEMKKKGLK